MIQHDLSRAGNMAASALSRRSGDQRDELPRVALDPVDRAESPSFVSPGHSPGWQVTKTTPALKGRHKTNSMSQSLAKILVHLTFSTKERRPLIRDQERDKLHAYVIGILKNLNSPSLETNSIEDHIHILFSLSKNHGLAKVVGEVKESSSSWIKTQDNWYRDFYWQGGYAAFSVSESQADTVRRYIVSQREHHSKKSFQDELRALFRKHKVEYDERYVWD